MGPDGPLGEHIRLAFQVAFFVQLLQRTEQEIRAVIGKGQGIGAGVDKPVFCGVAVVQPVQLGLGRLNRGIGDKTVHLLSDELLHTVPQLDHAFDALAGGGVQVWLYHDAVFAVVHFSIHNGVGVIFHIRVGGNRVPDFLVLTEIRQLRLPIFAGDVLHRLMELCGEVRALNGRKGKVLLAVLRTLRGRRTQHHFRVVDKIAVDGKAVSVLP